MTKQEAIILLTDMAKSLGRLPKKSDFTPVEVSRIKAKLGAWNRALEEAELKSVSPLYAKKQEKIKQKRIKKKQTNIGTEAE